MPRGSNFKRPYPPQFRREAIELYRRCGQPLSEVAHDLGIATESLRSWVKQAGIDAGVRDGLASEEREELRRLRRENRRLRVRSEEVREEILKTASASSRHCQSERRAQRVGSFFRCPAGVSVVVCFPVMPPAGRRSLRPGVT